MECMLTTVTAPQEHNGNYQGYQINLQLFCGGLPIHFGLCSYNYSAEWVGGATVQQNVILKNRTENIKDISFMLDSFSLTLKLLINFKVSTKWGSG
jgi:hypothetical protein